MSTSGKDVRAFTRSGLDWSDKYQRVIETCQKLRCRSVLIDGEIIVQDAKGVSDFAALRAAIEWEPQRLVLFAFDLMFLNGADLRRLPCDTRIGLTGPAILLEPQQALNVALIVHELTTNARKYARPRWFLRSRSGETQRIAGFIAIGMAVKHVEKITH